jgi:hypothetical protein
MGRIRVNQPATLSPSRGFSALPIKFASGITAPLCAVMGTLFVLATGCSTPAVGAPCLPEQIPETGFSAKEAYIESSSVQCETRVCLVYQLAGDPRDTCVPSADGERVCAEKSEVAERIYCTCRCDSQGSGFGECECPSGFSCVEVLSQGDRGVRGSYCVKSDTATPG